MDFTLRVRSAQSLPSPVTWALWKRIVLSLCCSGRWLTYALRSYTRQDACQWWFELGSQRVYGREGNQWRVFRKSCGNKTRSSASKFEFTGITDEMPKGCVPVTVQYLHPSVILTGMGELHLEKIISTTPAWIMDHISMPPNFHDKWLESNHCLSAVSDGSFKEKHGTAAWMICVSETCVIRGRTITPGLPSDQSAYRSELIGLYGIVYTIRYLC
jgi:hypothetical protein